MNKYLNSILIVMYVEETVVVPYCNRLSATLWSSVVGESRGSATTSRGLWGLGVGWWSLDKRSGATCLASAMLCLVGY